MAEDAPPMRADDLAASDAWTPEPDDGAGITTPWPEPPAEGEATEIAEGALWLRLPLPMQLDHVNCYAFAGGDGWTLIDTGMDTRRTRAIWTRLLTDGPLAGRPVARIIATHHHPDHIGLAGWFQEQGAQLWTSRTAWLMARMLVLDEQERPPRESIAFMRRAGMPPEMLARRAAERPFNFADSVHALPLGYTRLTEGQTVRFGGRDWAVRMGDGHAPEHITLWSRDDDLVIGGDQLLPGISPNLGVYPTEPEADPVADWLAACARLAPHARAGQLVLPGHKLPFRGLPARLRQLADNHVSALSRLEAALVETPMTPADSFTLLFRRQISADNFGLALVEAVAHFNHLAQAGRIRIVGQTPDGADLWRAGDHSGG
ncbi:MAG: MBL fold metallo-hydrolase [Paracoccus sp. (in: a-proteobacteria)]|nr:MBL fold metallo-hydrolase [Paracoccus sp. (in: a-proteobacteria)]